MINGFLSPSHDDEASSGRVYDPQLARFVQADPIIQDPRTTRSLNRYSYVWNNPLNATDPSGYTCNSIHRTRECETEVDDILITGRPNDGGDWWQDTDSDNNWFDDRGDDRGAPDMNPPDGASDNSLDNGGGGLHSNIIVQANPLTGEQTAWCEDCEGNAMLLSPRGRILTPGAGAAVESYRLAYIRMRSRAAGRAFDRRLAEERSTWFMPTARQAMLAAELNTSQKHLQQVMMGLGMSMALPYGAASYVSRVGVYTFTSNTSVGVGGTYALNLAAGQEQTARSLIVGGLLGGTVGVAGNYMTRVSGGGLGARLIWERNSQAISISIGAAVPAH